MPPIRWGATDTIEDGLTLNSAPAVCEREAEKFHRMAEAEPVEHIRQELLAIAEQYRRLAESLNARRRTTT
jgi:hypothetical protein